MNKTPRTGLFDSKVIILGDPNKQEFIEFILSLHHKPEYERTAFELVENYKIVRLQNLVKEIER